MSGSARSPAPAGEGGRRRLLRALPEVFVGADAEGALDGRPGLLFGAKRHRQVDLLGVEPAFEESPPGPEAIARLIERRWDRGAVGGWRVVGVTLGAAEFAAAGEPLLEGLVAGDVVAAVDAPGATGESGGAGLFVHRGDRFARVR